MMVGWKNRIAIGRLNVFCRGRQSVRGHWLLLGLREESSTTIVAVLPTRPEPVIDLPRGIDHSIVVLWKEDIYKIIMNAVLGHGKETM